MSLKGFHVVFVTVASLLFAFLILWAYGLSEEQSSLVTSMGYVGIGGLILMPFYGVYFLRKATRLHL